MALGGPGVGPDNLNMPARVIVDYENVEFFREFYAPGFKPEYLLIVSNQGMKDFNEPIMSTIVVFAYGTMEGFEY